jgi:uncharacterized membrane protein YdjX (TVP38/TMEM64 family)
MNQQDELTLTAQSRLISWKKWVSVFFVFVLGCAAALLVSRGDPGLGKIEVLILYLLYMSVAFTFLPLPTAWIVLWAAREVEPLSVALIGTVGTVIANLHDYYIIHYLFRVERLRKAKKSRFYRKSVEWFQRAPFLTLTAASFLPIPIDVVRILAVSADYPRRWYALATFAGRLPRYLLLAYLGYELQLSNKTIFIVFLITVAIGAAKGISKLRGKYKESADEED